jgi:ABC-type lipopolysaccharide export system ATPase subunit
MCFHWFGSVTQDDSCHFGPLAVIGPLLEEMGVADRVHVLENGRVVRSGTPADLRQDKAIQQAYLGL